MAGGKDTNGTAKKQDKSADDWEDGFITALAENGNIFRSCEAVKVARTTIYRRRNSDDDFRERMRDALSVATDKLEEEARKRALAGSDVLLIFLLKAHRPKKFRDNVKHELTGANGEAIDFSKIPAKDLEAAYRVINRATGSEPLGHRNGAH